MLSHLSDDNGKGVRDKAFSFSLSQACKGTQESLFLNPVDVLWKLS